MVIDLGNIGTIAVSLGVFVFFGWILYKGLKENSKQHGGGKGKDSGSSSKKED